MTCLQLKNETAIARSVRNLIFTLQGERFFNQDLGSRVSRALFENIDRISASVIEDEIRNTIDNFEPRVRLIDVSVTPDYSNNEFNVTLSYDIVGIDVPSTIIIRITTNTIMPLVNFTNLDFDQIKSSIKDYLRVNSNFTDYDFEGSNLSPIIDTLAYNTYILI